MCSSRQQFVPQGYTLDQLQAKPFHVYDEEFYAIIGSDPTLTLIAETDGDPLFHEAVVWYVTPATGAFD